MAVVGFDGRFKALTGAWSGLLGYSADELLGRRYDEFVHPDDCDATGRAISSLTDGQLMGTFENRFACRDGSYRWLAWTSMPTVNERLIYAVARDVTAERNRAQIDRARTAVTAVIAAAANWDQAVSGVLAAMSAELEWLRGEYWAMIDGVPRVARVWPDRPGAGVPAGESIASEVLEDLVPVVVRSRVGALPPTQARPKRIKAHGAVGFAVPTPAGGRAALCFVTPAHYSAEDGVVGLLTAVGGQLGELADRLERDEHDDEARRLAHATLEYRATHDSLTSLANRELMDDRLQRAMAAARRCQSEVAVLMIDVNGFKAVNDAHGHEFGDKVLRQVALRLKAIVRDSDAVGRIGGDEFAVVIGGRVNVAGAMTLAAKICGSFHSPLSGCGEDAVRVSVGVAMYPAHGDDERQLLRCADAAMYAAKSLPACWSM
jgi:diguanylate cyclase (GGDEF)-like protein/PAS domain S-box-containing protein